MPTGDQHSAPPARSSSQPSPEESKIACHNCRRRKVRCPRQLPACGICIHNGQTCEYPERSLKPGPKLGSKNARSKRRRVSMAGSQGGVDEDLGEDSPRRQSLVVGDVSVRRSSSVNSPGSLKDARDMQSLSFIIHPSHEPTSPEERQKDTPSQSFANGGSVIRAACQAMRITPDVLLVLVENFHNTFLSYQLFPTSRFWSRIGQIQDESQVTALLAAIVAFAVKLWDPDDTQAALSSTVASLSQFDLISLALRAADQALVACGDETPPLHLLQALVLVSHWLLIQGVRGRAWRYLGVCIRVAYEMNLHLIDSGKPSDWLDDNPVRWADDEERRRIWWAIWEMDVFASVIRRCPTGINWHQNETFLPSEDISWEQSRPQKSCVLEVPTMSRCKSLQATGNQSARAWFIVINSIMKDAQTISSPTGVNNADGLPSYLLQYDPRKSGDRTNEMRKRLDTYYNAARYFSMALPMALKYRGQYLNFNRPSPMPAQAEVRHLRELNVSIYSIHLMTQLAFLMTLKYNLFRTTLQPQHEVQNAKLPANTRRECATIRDLPDRTQKDIEEYFQASTSILEITNRSHQQFHRYVNPFLVNTIWLAAAVQLLRRELVCSSETEKELVTSNFEVLRMTYDMFVEFWRSDDTAKKNLEALQGQLKNFQMRAQQAAMSSDRSQALASSTGQNRQSDVSSHARYPNNMSPISNAESTSVPNANANTNSQYATDQQWTQPAQAPMMNSSTVPNMLGDGMGMGDSNFFDPFMLPNDFDFMGNGNYNSFDDVFSGSVF